ncbi:MAG: Ig-like domain-containing protein, partial [Acidobacteriota bacterium]
AGFVEPGQWLPALSDGTYLGPKPVDSWDRYMELNQLFSDSWRITDASSLFDYAPGTSTATFTQLGWPVEDATSCELPDLGSVRPVDQDIAAAACADLVDREDRHNCTVDVAVTGELEFAATYVLAQKLEQGGTQVEVHPDFEFTQAGKVATFVAVVKRSLTGERLTSKREGGVLDVGEVQFFLEGRPVGAPVKVDENGRARWTSGALQVGTHRVSARFQPAPNNDLHLASRSHELLYVVRTAQETDPETF